MKQKDLLQFAQSFIQSEDDYTDDEFYGTDRAMAELVLTKFLCYHKIPTWKVTFTWGEGENVSVAAYRFVLEETAKSYIATELNRRKKAHVGQHIKYTLKLCL